jgi:creatinine amidohydrolase/Fe(II)-dependent formamide hydrolase-like protein
MRTSVLLCLLVSIIGLPRAASAQVWELAKLNTAQIRDLDRARTVVIIPGGILEQHGPYLPAYADGYWNERIAQELAASVAARPGWAALMFPPIPLGVGGANEIGRRYSFPGTYALRSATLRSLFMDLASEFGEQGFRWIFVVHGHGAPEHNRMLDDAGDFFRDEYRGQMVHLMGLEAVLETGGGLDADVEKVEGFSVHAGAGETSGMLFLRPDLVAADVKAAPDRRGANMSDLVRLAGEPQWPGYFGAPRVASASQGARLFTSASAAASAYALKILDGLDPRTLSRIGDAALNRSESVSIDGDALRASADRLRRQEEWLAKRKAR